MKKILTLILINIIIAFGLLFVVDDIVSKNCLKNCIISQGCSCKKNYLIKNFHVHELNTYNLKREMPQIKGVDYQKPPVIIFGCSFAYGQYLNIEETFGYKLSKLLKIPVLIRAIPAGSFQHLYYQTTSKDFYKTTPRSDEVIYIMIDDHFRRSLVDFFDIKYDYLLLHYSLKKDKLVMSNYNNYFFNLVRSLYITRIINHKFAQTFIEKEKYKNDLINLTVKYFIESRNNLEKNWKNKVKFTVIFYGTVRYEKELSQELIKNGFNVIHTSDLTKQDLYAPPYIRVEDVHPTGKAWDLLTPLIAKKL